MNEPWKTQGSKCRSCGMPIVWLKTTAGKNMPCDAEPVLYWRDEGGKDTVITRAGEVIRCSLHGDNELLSSLGRVPHWVTCDSPEQFRMGGKSAQ